MTRFALVILTFAIVVAGCAPISYVSTLLIRDTVPAAYELSDRRMLVMVDDPGEQLGSAVLANVVADRITNDLKQGDIVTQFVPLTELQALADTLGDDYPATPIDLIGRRLGAAQVLYVKVEALELFAEPSMLRPRARVQVKVIDAERSERLFPAPTGGEALGYDLLVEMHHRYGDNADPGDSALLMREVADRIGRDVGRLFYRYQPNPPGHTLPD